MKFKKIFLLSVILLTILAVSAVSASDNITQDASAIDDSISESPINENEILKESEKDLLSGGNDSQMKIDFVKQYENGTIIKIDESKDIYVNDHESDYFRMKTPKLVTGTLSLYIDDKFVGDKEIFARTHYLFVNTQSYNLGEGNHTWNITYSGDDTYAPKTFSGTFVLNPPSDTFKLKNPKMESYVVTKDKSGVIYGIDADEDISALSLVATDYFKIKFPKRVTGTLYLYVDNVLKSTKNIAAKTHYFYANDASYKLKAGKHTWKIVYSGDGEYASSQVNGTYALKIMPVKVKSNKTTSTLSVPKNKVYKVSLKTKKYTATLKTNKKVLKKVRVYLTIHGKNYKKTLSALTNNKGQVTFKITGLTKKGSYKGTITYKGSKTAKSIGKKLTITLNKKKATFKAGANIKDPSEDYVTVYNPKADINGSIDVSPLYDYLNNFRCEKGVWQWAENDIDKVVFNTNKSNTLKPLERDTTLEAVAQFRAKECSEKFSHTRPDGSVCFSVYPTKEDGFTARGENIAKWQKTYDEVMNSWKETNEPYAGQGHRQSMLSSKFNCVGIGAYKLNGKIYWVQSFGYNSNL